MFELTKEEVSLVKSQIVTSRPSNFFAGQEGGRRKPPLAFSEQGIYMLASVLHGELAEKQSIFIMRAFRAMRQFLADNALVFQRLDRIEMKQIESDYRINMLYDILESPKPDKAVIFYCGQMWDATSCIEEIISNAEKSIILIDSYVDKGTLDMLSRKKAGVTISIHTVQKSCKLTEKEISALRSQYGKLEIRYTDEFHDRFLILDNKELYHIGASIKDAGRKTFEISLNEDEKMLTALLSRL